MTDNLITEKDMLQDILVLEKDIVKTYASYLIEASCENLRDVLNENLRDSACDQFNVFSAMNERNLYPVKDAPQTEVDTAKKKFTGIANQLS